MQSIFPAEHALPCVPLGLYLHSPRSQAESSQALLETFYTLTSDVQLIVKLYSFCFLTSLGFILSLQAYCHCSPGPHYLSSEL